jgi:prophage DNA circulation protein
MALAQESKIVIAMTFTSRQDVDAMILAVQNAFADPIETAADTMDAMVFRALVALQASLINHLVSTARPLPQMVAYQFATSLPSLVISQKLYGDASRYDEIRNENKIVHPAFCPPIGLALSS